MKIITINKSTAVEGTITEPRGVLTQIHDEPVKGFFRRAKLTSTALILERRDTAIAIPLSELWKVAEEHEPDLVPPKLVTQEKKPQTRQPPK